MLSNLGEEEHVKTEAYSWEKLVHYNNFSNHTIHGEVYSFYENTEKFYFYLDLNHNQVHDPGEPMNKTFDKYYFQFTNLDPGIYSVRNTEVKNCYQILPGVSLRCVCTHSWTDLRSRLSFWTCCTTAF